MKKILTVLVLCSCVALGNGPRILSHALSGAVGSRVSPQQNPLRILAVMVQFKEDSDTKTSGTGHFDLSDSLQRIIDAPPRDSAYFADHFRFAKNYYSKVSNGRQNITFTVMGRVITLRDTMKVYAADAATGNLPLTRLVDDAWRAADSLNPGFPFQDYDLFVIFHAGSGKDIDLRASLGFDPTPYDLPSIYFSLPAMQKLRGASYAGVRLKNNFTITNSVILPETENRTIGSGADAYLLQLGINGLIVANIASHLGLPDLFDTRTGRTAIGRFGLMDGQSIFSYSGLFPPAPSAWERAYLGWATPVTITAGAAVQHARLAAGSDTIVKVPIGAKEYFLLENRQRDKNKDGQTVTIRWRGQEFTKHFPNDTSFFSYANVDSIYGTVVDVDEVDWSLPGLINAYNNYHGGILIWHIDETVIDRALATNSINADENRRGVDLDEADGSQDIGQSYGTFDAGGGSEDGSPLDYWFAENQNPDNNPVYKNEFSETTNPNSLSNTKAHSHVMINNFSPSAAVMTFDVGADGSGLALEATIRRSAAKADNSDGPFIADINRDGTGEIFYTSGGQTFVLQPDRKPFTGFINGSQGFNSGTMQPTFVPHATPSGAPGLTRIPAATQLDVLVPDSAGVTTPSQSYATGSRITTPAHVRVGDVGIPMIAIGDANGFLYELYPARPTATHLFTTAVQFIANAVPGWFVGTGDSVVSTSNNARAGWTGKTLIAMSAFGTTDGACLAALYDNNDLSVFSAQLGTKAAWKVPAKVNAALALADVNGDGRIDIVVGTAQGVYAYNATGALIERFPLAVIDGGAVVGAPTVFRKKSDGTAVVCFGSTNGQVYAYGADGKLLAGFPLQTGGIASSVTAASQYLIAASTDSSLYFWNIGGLFDLSKPSWSGYLGDASHTNYAALPQSGAQRSDELLPKALAYNWPNPAYDKTTHIRYYLGKAATVTVKIFTMAGESVATLQGSGAAHTDNEIDWDVSSVQSGIYLAQIEADANGEKSSTLIKIAVVK